MSSDNKKKVKKRKVKKASSDDLSYEYTLGSDHILTDYQRQQEQAIDALPVLDPDSEHFDESKYDKTEYHRQSLDWVDYDTSSELQLKYSTKTPKIYEQYSIDLAPFDDSSINEEETDFVSNKAFSYVGTEGAHIEQTQFGGTIDTNLNAERVESADDENVEHPSEGGDARKFIEHELKTQSERYKEWKKYDDGVPEPWNTAMSEPYEHKDNWWNTNSKRKYDMPHQALHGGVNKFDEENDIPLNAWWHKATVSPDSWHVMKGRFRDSMRPGSEMWNKWAFRTEFERKTLKWWPETGKLWFLRHEDELLHSHEFRCKMLEHSALDEYWRMGELRWNRKLWEPYIRIGTWVVAPVLGGFMTWLWRRAVGTRSNAQFDEEFKRWKETCAKDEGDEYYMFHWRDSLQKRRPPPVVAPPPSLEETGKRSQRSMSYHVDKLMRGKQDPY